MIADNFLVFARINDELHQIVVTQDQQFAINYFLQMMFHGKAVPVLEEKFCKVEVLK